MSTPSGSSRDIWINETCGLFEVLEKGFLFGLQYNPFTAATVFIENLYSSVTLFQ